jgi:hypothetical protein
LKSWPVDVPGMSSMWSKMPNFFAITDETLAIRGRQMFRGRRQAGAFSAKKIRFVRGQASATPSVRCQPRER